MGSKTSRAARKAARQEERRRREETARRHPTARQAGCVLVIALSASAAGYIPQESYPPSAQDGASVMSELFATATDQNRSIPITEVVQNESTHMTTDGDDDSDETFDEAIVLEKGTAPILEPFDPVQDEQDWIAITHEAENERLLDKLVEAAQRPHDEELLRKILVLKYALKKSLAESKLRLEPVKRRAYAHITASFRRTRHERDAKPLSNERRQKRRSWNVKKRG